jgi:hypothetical protein
MAVTAIGIGVLAMEHVVRVAFWNSEAARAAGGWIVGVFG